MDQLKYFTELFPQETKIYVCDDIKKIIWGFMYIYLSPKIIIEETWQIMIPLSDITLILMKRQLTYNPILDYKYVPYNDVAKVYGFENVIKITLNVHYTSNDYHKPLYIFTLHFKNCFSIWYGFIVDITSENLMIHLKYYHTNIENYIIRLTFN